MAIRDRAERRIADNPHVTDGLRRAGQSRTRRADHDQPLEDRQDGSAFPTRLGLAVAVEPAQKAERCRDEAHVAIDKKDSDDACRQDHHRAG